MTKLQINTQALKDFEKRLNKVLNAMPTVMGQAAVNHFQENITKRQGLAMNGSLQRFQNRVFEGRKRGNNILNNAGNMLDSIKIIRRSNNQVEVGIRSTEIPYAEIHQQGGRISVTDKMRKFFWAQYYQHATGSSRNSRGRNKRSSSSLGSEASFWKAMAMKRKNATIDIPKRQFMAVTPDLEKTILRVIQTEMNHII